MSEAKPLTPEEVANKKAIWERLAAEFGVEPNSNAELTGRLLATIAALQREKAEETKRMDWLESNSFKAQKICWDKHCGKFRVWNLREAIDAAMSETK